MVAPGSRHVAFNGSQFGDSFSTRSSGFSNFGNVFDGFARSEVIIDIPVAVRTEFVLDSRFSGFDRSQFNGFDRFGNRGRNGFDIDIRSQFGGRSGRDRGGFSFESRGPFGGEFGLDVDFGLRRQLLRRILCRRLGCQ